MIVDSRYNAFAAFQGIMSCLFCMYLRALDRVCHADVGWCCIWSWNHVLAGSWPENYHPRSLQPMQRLSVRRSLEANTDDQGSLINWNHLLPSFLAVQQFCNSYDVEIYITCIYIQYLDLQDSHCNVERTPQKPSIILEFASELGALHGARLNRMFVPASLHCSEHWIQLWIVGRLPFFSKDNV